MDKGYRPAIARCSLALAGLLGIVAGLAAPAGAAEPLAVDQARVDDLALMVAAERATFGGISIDEATGTLTVRYTKRHEVASVKSKLTGFTKTRGQHGKRNKLVLEPVERSLKDLDAVRGRLSADADWKAATSKVISQHYIDVKRNLVAVGVTEITPEVAKLAQAKFGGLVSLHVAARQERASRTDDFEPWTAGIRIWSASSGCTTGFIIKNNTNPASKQMVSAGHCGGVGTAWNNNGDPVGTTNTSVLTEDGFDYGYISGRSYEAWMYTGPATSDVGHWIGGTYLSFTGRKYCTNGATSGEVCWGTVSAIDACITFSDGITTCFLDVLNSDSGAVMSRPGDSGGPVISYVDGKLKLGGIIIGGSNPTYFHSYHYVVPSGWSVDFVA